MSETSLAAPCQEAQELLRQMPDEELTKPAGGVPRQRRVAGIAAGKFVVPDDIDADNELIADLFEGRAAP